MRKIFFTLLIFPLFIVAQQQKYLIVNKIGFQGNKKTKTSILVRELTFKQGDTLYDWQADIKQSTINVKNTLLFHYVKPEYTIQNQYINIIFRMQERWYFWPYPIFDVAGQNWAAYTHNKDWDYLNYGVRLEQKNFRGKAQSLKLRLRLGVREQYGIEYNIPYIFNSKNWGLFFDESLFRQKQIHVNSLNYKYIDSSFNKYIYHETRTLFGISHRDKINSTHLLYCGYRNYNYNQEIDTLFNNEILNRKWFIVLGYNFKYLKTNYNPYPLEGIKLDFKIETGKGNYEYTYINITSSFHKKTTDKISISTGLNLFITPDKTFPYYLRQGAGESWYMRGNEDYIFQNQFFALNRIQLKLSLFETNKIKFNKIKSPKFNNPNLKIYFNIFTENAFSSNFSTPTSSLTLNSVGAGFDFVTYYDWIGRIEFTYNQFHELLTNINWGYMF